MNTFGKRLSYLRKEKHLTQTEMAQKLKSSQSHIANLESGRKEPSDLIIYAICNEFGVNETWLRSGEGSPYYDANYGLMKTFAHYFVEISKAYSPVFDGWGEVIKLFENEDIMRMYNYIAYKVKKGGFTENNLTAITTTFDVAFPGYETVVKDLEHMRASVRFSMNSSNLTKNMNPTTVIKEVLSKHEQAPIYKHVEGKAAAGHPINAISDKETKVFVPEKYYSDNYFVVQAQGDSMINANIFDGDYCIFQKDGYFDEGFILLVQIDNETDIPDVTIKRMYKDGDNIILRPENPMYKSLSYPAESIRILGVLVDIASNA